MTPERIAEIYDGCKPTEVGGEIVYNDYNWKKVGAREIAELCRLARLGLMVEGARVADPFPAMGLVDQHLLTGKRVALVVLEDSE